MINGLSVSTLTYSLALTISLPAAEVFPEETMDLELVIGELENFEEFADDLTGKNAMKINVEADLLVETKERVFLSPYFLEELQDYVL